MMMNVLAAIARGFFNLLYKLFDLLPRKNEVLFFSRQSSTPSDDFILLDKEFEERDYSCVLLTKKLGKRNVLPYAWHSLRGTYHLARCRICFLDGYNPVVSLINFQCQKDPKASDGEHNEFPVQPVIVQMWHAFGAYKKFGYQCLDTREGRSSDMAKLFNMHRNYSWIICTGESNRSVFAEAFAYPVDRVVALGRPEYDLLAQRAEQASKRKAEGVKQTRPVILFAPTLRRSQASQHPFKDLYFQRDRLLKGIDADFIWSFHPVEQGDLPQTDSNKALEKCDILVTDYSSIAYEAYLLRKKVFFYVPDIEEYRKSPGLNIDPLKSAPKICVQSAKMLVGILVNAQHGAYEYQTEQLDGFIADTFDGLSANVTDTIVAWAHEEAESCDDGAMAE